ncbi:hypothetical protein BJV85_000538 [Clostridium acetobutylicum]|uniref:Barstar-like protein, ribonuclease (Barnase) inhibitor n=1 Tax=Clostridium acetobutylicum (strain ATCC 824 / DSM 792 / JCM 1419 / IAM 19013 / LMG 5710 / NBRC 13948 / NRRL B-527 / VKM B-1787 / 2291 / W) TaxID=272562 RepID=Q97DV6_CLOAB|nr:MULTISPECIES: barstar family protein [Clostridium]AAK81296.1 Barstar-like protein, ribonuclease (barnase) inhibitor [Clostridium acetobutylicum ATCC 824]ADZ22404.1 Barstar-like protein, ribonuclease (barnase) inhibitor [Clostridium acetobutylicum EA 2018]AEI32798.1 barstar-like protein, ribonuclease (barnase) inhibitor [Clostridium acetobutylicum DSM 1731]AWV81038.1 barnase inhibitor [Clostridium acetobutylicum]MBC2395551.1 barnase inhibitor [Clostridium acetobutylicum]
MKYKFSLSCDDELVGYCQNIIGLNGDSILNNDNVRYHKLELIDFQVCDEYLKYLKKSKATIIGPCTLDVLDFQGISIGEYQFSIIEEIKHNELEKIKNDAKLSLIVVLNSITAGDEIEIWDKWRTGKPNQKNEWIKLSDENKEAWLNIVKIYHFSYKRSYYEPYENVSYETYYLDGNNITTYESFFCALGEAINGPGGYYGTDELNILDCLTGGFKACAPFKLVWRNHKIALKNLSITEWENKIERNKKENSKIFEDDYFHSKPEKSFFDTIIEIFVEHKITVMPLFYRVISSRGNNTAFVSKAWSDYVVYI